MEKRKPHYPLADIQAQMISTTAMNLTFSAMTGIRLAGMATTDALTVVRALTSGNFHKSMTTHQSNRTWQDVYHAEWRGKPLYVKFQRADDYFVVSFKEI